MKITILTLFPSMFVGPFDSSIIKRAVNRRLVTLEILNLRNFACDKYKSVDDRPYGGGTGMILRIDIVDRAISQIQQQAMHQKLKQCRIVLLDPTGQPYTQKVASKLSKCDHLILICGHYEGVDARIHTFVDDVISIGDFILTGGEIPAMAIIDSVVRLLPKVLSKPESTSQESFSQGLLEYPQYTKPLIYKNLKVPAVLLSGNHAKIADWRRKTAYKLTQMKRPDLIKKD